MEILKTIFVTLITTTFVNNVVLSQFLGFVRSLAFQNQLKQRQVWVAQLSSLLQLLRF